MDRPTWDETWLDIAESMRLRSRCARAKVGCVIVGPDERVVATGYNGPPSGLVQADRGPCSEWCPRAGDGAVPQAGYEDCFAIHAEANALIYADRKRVEGGTLYVTSAVCYTCAKLVANSGVNRVVFRVRPEESFRDPTRTRGLLHNSGVEVRVIESE